MPDAKFDQLAKDYEALYRSFIALHKEVEHLSTLREIGLAINSTLELNDTLTIIVNVVQGALDVSRVTIYQLDKTGKVALPVIAKYGQDLISHDRLKEETAPLVGTSLGEALGSRKVCTYNSDMQCSAYVPLIAQDKPVGIMRIDDHLDGTDFTDDDASLLQLLGLQIAVAINNAQLYVKAVTDGLTGLYVRRYFDLRMDEEFEQARRYGRNFSMLLLDIDHFKAFNDTHGHQTGDVVLRQFADLLVENTRKTDICCRYGGEEVAIILPETALNEASLLASKLCTRVRTYAFQGMSNNELSVTCSIGVAAYRNDYGDAAKMVEASDKALYLAKSLGRNRAELAGI